MSFEKPTISVIVPVYKVEKYLRRCVDSILAQTYADYEVILVDDGSPDQCGAICDEYADRYGNVSVIHQANGGLSAARNNAVPKSRGEYITFIDSDDFVTPDYLDYLMGLTRRYNAEISVGNLIYQYDSKDIKAPAPETKSEFFTPEDALITMNYLHHFGATAWGKLYRRELVEANPYPVGRLYEDLATTYKIVGASKGVAYGNRQIYYWTQRADSIMHSGFNERQMDGIEAAKAQLEYITKNFSKAVPAAKARYAGKIVEIMSLALHAEDSRKAYKRVKSEMKYYRDVMADPRVKKSQKLRLFGIKCGYLPAKCVFSIHEKLKERKY